MPVLLPFKPSIPFQRVSTTLAGIEYVLQLRWNGRDEAWYLDVLTEDEDVIRAGVKIVLGSLLGRRSVDVRFPPGVLIATDHSGAGVDASLDDLGVRVAVYFYTLAEMDEMLALAEAEL